MDHGADPRHASPMSAPLRCGARLWLFRFPGLVLSAAAYNRARDCSAVRCPVENPLVESKLCSETFCRVYLIEGFVSIGLRFITIQSFTLAFGSSRTNNLSWLLPMCQSQHATNSSPPCMGSLARWTYPLQMVSSPRSVRKSRSTV